MVDAPGLLALNPQSILVWLSQDTRTCWAGRGIYGLYRHGLLPGARDLGSIAAVFAAAINRPMLDRELAFVLRWVGYRFQPDSMYLALLRSEERGYLVLRHGGWAPSGRSVRGLLRVTKADSVARIVERARVQAEEAMRDREHRLTRSG